MKSNKQEYEAPQFEINEVRVEQGFQVSGSSDLTTNLGTEGFTGGQSYTID